MIQRGTRVRIVRLFGSSDPATNKWIGREGIVATSGALNRNLITVLIDGTPLLLATDELEVL